LLCENWSSEDNITFTFEIKPNIAMNDGSWLTADDVAYTLSQALIRGRYVNRFKSVDKVTSDGDMTVTVVLYAPNSRFINLLDVPIIKSGTIESRNPPGTGPYMFADEEVLRLDRFTRHRDFTALPVTAIYLRTCDDYELAELFDDGELSLLWDDPSDAFDIRLNSFYEPRFYETSAMQFVGVNSRQGIMRDQDVRRAIGCSIDRQYIVEEVLAGQQASAAPLALSPAFWLYDKAWEDRDWDPLVEMTLLLVQAGLDDYNNDSFLEITDGFGGYEEFSVDFIVNSENTHRVKAAHKIADTLKQIGFNISVRELPWESFMDALNTGDFDMYYGEIVLSADFNLSPLLLPGGLNYGGTVSSEYRPLIENFLMARSDDDVRLTAKRLCDEITIKAPFAPVLYKKYAIYTPLGAISGAAPSQSSVFRNFTDWTIDLTMLA